MSEPTATPLRCPSCGSDVTPEAAFCENCGSPLTPTEAPAVTGTEDLEAPIELTRSVRAQPAQTQPTVPASAPCTSCGGVVGADGYCETCGTKALSVRDHYNEQPASWVAACCDKGIRHHRNEDATAVAADPEPGSRAILVVCDGVSTSLDSDVASLAAARAAREVLVGHRPAGMGVPGSRAAAIAAAMETATTAANTAVVDSTAPESDNAASCTFAAAVVIEDLVVFANVGDSRVYWLPDPGSTPAEQPAELSLDDSVAQARIAMGVSREEAENGPQAHAITKWLGRDSPDFSPRTGSITVTNPGWLLVCSDGLWNYASEAADLQTLVGQLGGPTAEPLTLADALVRWANEQGGKDNISAALARL
ncbi:MAG TPA: protein phosphatase 2C domain-containing protein [Propionibacteriaceae bacterium]